MLARKKVICIH